MCVWFILADRHILIGAEEGIYSLNISDQVHEAEMEQVRGPEIDFYSKSPAGGL